MLCAPVSPSRRSGYTLLELLIVVFLITLVLGFSALFFTRTLSSSKLHATARELSATMRYARSLAQIQGAPQSITVDLDGKSYGIEGRGNKQIPGDLSVKVLDPLAGEVTTGKHTILFSGAGGIEGGKIVLSYDRQSVTVEPDPIVGSVVIK